jgi:hypothetical protein
MCTHTYIDHHNTHKSKLHGIIPTNKLILALIKNYLFLCLISIWRVFLFDDVSIFFWKNKIKNKHADTHIPSGRLRAQSSEIYKVDLSAYLSMETWRRCPPIVTTQIFVIHFLWIKVPNFGPTKTFSFILHVWCIFYYMSFMISCVL